MPDVKLVPIQRMTAAQGVAEQIMGLIRAGDLRPGDQLPAERELMQKLNVGRSSVREALQILATLNLIESRAGAGTFVRQPQTADQLRADGVGLLIANSAAFELIEARQMIEPVAVRLACLRATDEDLDRIDRLLDDHQEAYRKSEPTNYFAARFHVLLAQASGNRVAEHFMESIMGLLIARGRKLDRIAGYGQVEIEEHRAIVRLIRARDADASEAAIRNHIISSAQTYDAGGDGGLSEHALVNGSASAKRAEG